MEPICPTCETNSELLEVLAIIFDTLDKETGNTNHEIQNYLREWSINIIRISLIERLKSGEIITQNTISTKEFNILTECVGNKIVDTEMDEKGNIKWFLKKGRKDEFKKNVLKKNVAK